MPLGSVLIAQLDAIHHSRGGDWYYRTFAPGRALAELPNVNVVSLDQAHRHKARVLEAADVLVLHGVCDADLLPLITRRKRAGKVTVFEVSDDVSDFQPQNPSYGFFSAPENLRLFGRLVQSSDAAQYSSAELARVYGFLNPHGRVFRNHLPELAELPAASSRGGGAPLRVGWGGSNGHYDDIARVAPALIGFVQAHDDVHLHLMCSEPIWRLFEALPTARKQRTLPGSLAQYTDFVRQLDIGIAPLEDTAFNRSRSDVKYLEYASGGAVALVQALTPYLENVKHDRNGVLFGSAAELREQLERLRAQPEERARLREAAHRYVARERRQSAHSAARLAFYEELLSARARLRGLETMSESRSRTSAGSSFDELAQGEGAEPHGRHLDLRATDYEVRLRTGLECIQTPGGLDQGAALLRQAAALAPEQFLPHLYLGAQIGGEDELLAALKLEPRSVESLLALGQLYLAEGRPKAALERFLAAAELTPGFELPYLHAARALSALGAAAEAAEFQRVASQLARCLYPSLSSASPPRDAGSSATGTAS